LPIVIPEGTAGIIINRKLQHGVHRVFDQQVEATGE
jgi:hypothetical protein